MRSESRLELDLPFQDLASRALRDRPEANDPRILVRGYPLFHEIAQLLSGGCGTLLEGHQRGDFFPAHLVRHSEDGCFGHSRMGVHDLLNLSGIYVVATSVDHVLLAVDDEIEAVLVAAGEIS